MPPAKKSVTPKAAQGNVPLKRGRKPRPPKTTITRRVFFYRVNAGVHQDTGVPKNPNFGPALKHLNTLTFDEDGRYLRSTTEDVDLCCWVLNTQAPYRLLLANIRRGQHPPIEMGGAFSPLVLGDGKGLAEITHFVLFSDGVCGVEFNQFGPRASQLAVYMGIKLRGVAEPFVLASIQRKDLEERMQRLTDITLLDLKARASFSEELVRADTDLGGAFKAAIACVQGRPEDEFQIKFKRKKNKKLARVFAPTRLINGIRSLVGRPELKEQVSIFKLEGQDGRSQLIDVLREQFTSSEEIKPSVDRTSAVDSTSMFEAIEAAYESIKEQLANAQTIE